MSIRLFSLFVGIIFSAVLSLQASWQSGREKIGPSQNSSPMRSYYPFLSGRNEELSYYDKKLFNDVMLGDVNGVQSLLIFHKCNVNARTKIKKETPLHKAARRSPEIVKLLLDNNADINAQNENGRTPLHACAQVSHDAMYPSMKPRIIMATAEIAQMLIDVKANINARDKTGCTPLHLSDYGSSPFTTVTDVLINAGASLRIRNKDNQIAGHRHVLVMIMWQHSWSNMLFEKVFQGDVIRAKKLLGQVSFSRKGDHGNNLLHAAVASGNKDMVGLILLLQPSLIVQENDLGQSPLDLRKVHSGTLESTQLLLKYFVAAAYYTKPVKTFEPLLQQPLATNQATRCINSGGKCMIM